MEFSSQFGYITTRGIAAQLFLKILKSVFSKNVCMLLPNWGKPLFFWMQEISSEQHKWKVFKKKKKSFSLRSIPKEYTFADISPNILMPISKFLQQLIYWLNNFDNKTLLYNNNCKSLMYC